MTGCLDRRDSSIFTTASLRRGRRVSGADSFFCEHAFVGVSGTDHAELLRCLKAGNYLNACSAARSLAVVPLDAALDLTLLAAEKDPDRYEDMARRWLVRWMEETEPGLVEIPVVIGQLRARTRPTLR